MRKVLVTMPIKDEEQMRMERELPGYEFTFQQDAYPEEALCEAEIIVGKPPIDVIRRAPKLVWIQSDFAGVDHYMAAENTGADGPGEAGFPRNILLTNVTGAFGHSISEYLLTMVLSLYKKLPIYRDQQKEGVWKDQGEERTLTGKTVLIVGAGDIGCSFAKLLSVFGSKVIGIRRVARGIPEFFDEMHTLEDLETLLPQADVAAFCLPSTPSTRHLMDERRLRMMKRDAVFLNVGRGDVVVTEDLARVLEDGYLYGAAMDVTDPEPLPGDHPLWKFPNVIITPHVSGGSYEHLYETYQGIVEICIENLKRYEKGEPLKNVIDFETGYRRVEEPAGGRG